jgi:hypothetical protein
MSSRGTIPGCTQVLYDYIELYKCQSLDLRSVDTVYILNSLTFVQSKIIIKHLFTSGYFTPKTHYNRDIYFLQYMVPYRGVYSRKNPDQIEQSK